MKEVTFTYKKLKAVIGCKYCTEYHVRHAALIGNRDGLGVVKINYCPMCGRDFSKR